MTLDDRIGRRLRSLMPSSIVAIGKHAGRLAGAYAATAGACESVRIELPAAPSLETVLGALEASKRAALGIASDLPGDWPEGEAAALLARLRDRHTERLWLVTGSKAAARASWTRADLLALGFTVLDADAAAPDGPALYAHDVATYKQTPRWLSPEHWANPERWDKSRW